MLAALYWGSRKETLQASRTCWLKTRCLLVQAGLIDKVSVVKELDADVIEESPQAGYRFSWRSPGNQVEQLSLHVLCGAWASASNAVLLNVPDSGIYCFEEKASDYLWAFSELIEIWDPLEGIVCRHEDLAWAGARLSQALPCVQRYNRDTRVCLDGASQARVPDLLFTH